MKKIWVVLSVFVIALILAILSCEPTSMSQADIAARNKAYGELKEIVKTYRDDFNNKVANFKKDNPEFNIPFDRFGPVFERMEAKVSVYASVGYDLRAIERLEGIFKNLDLKADYTIGDTKVVYDILYLLKEITEPIDEILNVYLSDTHLSEIGTSKDAGTISIITFNLKRAKTSERDLVLQMMDRILAIDLTSSKQVVLQKLKEIIDDGLLNAGVRFVREIARRISKIVK